MKRYTGKTLEELLATAAQEKGCSVEELTYFVAEEKNGFLGIGSSVSADVYCKDDIKEFLFDYLGNFFTGIDQDLEVSIEERDDTYIVRMSGENNAVLIGKMGKTLSAFNTVVRGAVNAEFKKRIDVLIDVNNYKEDRYHKLESMAKRIAKQVINSKVDVELDPMPSDERKTIHRILNTWDNIQTVSEGEGAQRHLCIRYVGEKDEPQPEQTDEIVEEVKEEI